MAETVGSKPSGRKKRPRVPELERKRAMRACDPCRRHKEKCEGGTPCSRCQQYSRTCTFTAAGNKEGEEARDSSSPCLTEKYAYMERILRHFVGDITLDMPNLQRLTEMVERRQFNSRNTPQATDRTDIEDLVIDEENCSIKPLSANTSHYSGEFSYWNFSMIIKHKLKDLEDNGSRCDNDYSQEHEFFRATDLQSPSSFITSSMMYFPPRQVADFLTDTFIRYGQTNYFYFDQATFRHKLDHYYADSPSLAIEDAGWICTILMTFAISTQFAYLRTTTSPLSTEEEDDQKSQDNFGIELYRYCSKLIPDLITIASMESVQAFILLGIYTLPVDTSGLAYTYFGLAIKMAIQNGMHRKYSGGILNDEIVQLRNHLWWTAYTLERRISILHGRPVSISPVDVDVELPDGSALPHSDKVSNQLNISAMIHLTLRLGDAQDIISRLRKSHRTRQRDYFVELLALRKRIRDWWSSLPEEIYCRDLNPQGPLFRCNVHLKLTHAVIQIYMGRPFILSAAKNDKASTDLRDPSSQLTNRSLLIADCVQSALEIIDLCQLLQDNAGLARASYTEFSSCRAAILVIIAKSLDRRTDRLRVALSHGLRLIRQMCVGLESAKSEVAVLEALEQASQRLDYQKDSQDTPTNHNLGYGQFKNWAKLWQKDSIYISVQSPPGSHPLLDQAQNYSVEPFFNGFLSSFPHEINEFASISGSESQLSPLNMVQQGMDFNSETSISDEQWSGLEAFLNRQESYNSDVTQL